MWRTGRTGFRVPKEEVEMGPTGLIGENHRIVISEVTGSTVNSDPVARTGAGRTLDGCFTPCPLGDVMEPGVFAAATAMHMSTMSAVIMGAAVTTIVMGAAVTTIVMGATVATIVGGPTIVGGICWRWTWRRISLLYRRQHNGIDASVFASLSFST